MKIPIFVLRIPFFFYLDALVGFLFGVWSRSDLPSWPPPKSSDWFLLYTIVPTELLTAWTVPFQSEPALKLWRNFKPLFSVFYTESVAETIPVFYILFVSVFFISHLFNPRNKLERALRYFLTILQQLSLIVALKWFMIYREWMFSRFEGPDAELFTRPLFILQFVPILIGLLSTQEFGPVSLWMAVDGAAMILYVPSHWMTVLHSFVLMGPIGMILFDMFFYYADALEQAINEICTFWRNRGQFWIIEAAHRFKWQPSLASYWMIRATWILCRHVPKCVASLGELSTLNLNSIVNYYNNLSVETMPDFLHDFFSLSTETIVCVYGFSIAIGYVYDHIECVCIRLLQVEDRQETTFLSSGGLVAMYFSTMAFELNMIPHSREERVQLSIQLLSISLLVFLWPLYQLIKTQFEALQTDRNYSLQAHWTPLVFSNVILVTCAFQSWHYYQRGLQDSWSLAVMTYSLQTFFSVRFCSLCRHGQTISDPLSINHDCPWLLVKTTGTLHVDAKLATLHRLLA
jgi:hypothetical protein